MQLGSREQPLGLTFFQSVQSCWAAQAHFQISNSFAADAEGNTRLRWSLACEYTGLLPVSIHVFERGWVAQECQPPYKCHPSRVHMYTRRQVATEKGIDEAICKLAIVTSFAYQLPTIKQKCQF